MGWALLDAMRLHRERVCQIDATTGRSETYGQVLRRAISIAKRLSADGIVPGDVVTLCAPNIPEACAPLLGALFIGARVASLDPTLPPHDCQHLLRIVAPRVAFVHQRSMELVETALITAGVQATIIPLNETYTDADDRDFKAYTITNPKETAFIFFSSGTTGLAKGVCTPHSGLLSQCMFLMKHLDLKVCMNFTSFYWISAVMVLTMATLRGGARLLMKRFDALETAQSIQKHRVTFAFMAPIYLCRLSIDSQVFNNIDTTHLDILLVGGGSTPQQHMRHLRTLLPHTHVLNAYGMTEASGCLSIFRKGDHRYALTKPLSCGKPVPGITYRIVDTESERLLPLGERGELRVKGACLMNGYCGHSSASDESVFDSDGFMRTGDVAYFDTDNYMYVVDRIKDLLKFQSWHVAPAEIEGVVAMHPAVAEVVVVGLPHDVDGDLPAAVVVLRPNYKNSTTKEQLRQFVDGERSIHTFI